MSKVKGNTSFYLKVIKFAFLTCVVMLVMESHQPQRKNKLQWDATSFKFGKERIRKSFGRYI